MPFQFTDPNIRPYVSGDIFLGRSIEGNEIGIETEKHIITIAGSRSGKGATLLIPNLKRWPHNALVIDPKGENAEQTWRDREAMGQKVHILDPFGSVAWQSSENPDGVPCRLRSNLNPLADLDPSSCSIREDIRVIADGLVIRYRGEDATWDNGAVSVLAGVIAHAVASGDPEYQTLTAVRALLRLPEDDLEPVFQAMAQTSGMGNLASTAASIGLGRSKADREFVGGAKRHTEWLDSEPMEKTLGSSDFSLSDLKTGEVTVYLVLPPHYLGEHGRFLRLFVRCALNAMAKSGQKGRKCLFFLDEFFALGRIDEILESCGAMPSYGVHLWPFLQDLGQLQSLYQVAGSETFFANSDAHIFFGNSDQLTLEYISRKTGVFSPDEIGSPPEVYGGQYSSYHDKNAMNAYNHKMRVVGQPRITSTEAKEILAKKDGYKVAKSMLVFAKGSDIFNLIPCPYFETYIKPPPPPLPPQINKLDLLGFIKAFLATFIIILGLPIFGISYEFNFTYIFIICLSVSIIILVLWPVLSNPSTWPYASLSLKFNIVVMGVCLIVYKTIVFIKIQSNKLCSIACVEPVFYWMICVTFIFSLSFIWYKLISKLPEKS